MAGASAKNTPTSSHVFTANLCIDNRRDATTQQTARSGPFDKDARTSMSPMPTDARPATTFNAATNLPRTSTHACFPIAATFLRSAACGREAATMCRRSGIADAIGETSRSISSATEE